MAIAPGTTLLFVYTNHPASLILILFSFNYIRTHTALIPGFVMKTPELKYNLSALCITRSGWWRDENRAPRRDTRRKYRTHVSTLSAGGKFLRRDFIVSHRNFISRRRTHERSRIEREYEITNGKRVPRLFLFLPLHATFRVNRGKLRVSS